VTTVKKIDKFFSQLAMVVLLANFTWECNFWVCL